MKEQTSRTTIYKCHENDNRELVNLDFYENEIKIMARKLDEVSASNSTKEIKNKVDNLNNLLNLQKLILEEFRKNYDVKEMFYGSQLNLKKGKIKNKAESDRMKNNESFFQHLQSFEKSFKVVREKVLNL